MTATTTATTDVATAVAPRTRRRVGGDRFGTNLVIAGSVLLGLVVLAAFGAPLLTEWGATEMDPMSVLVGPGGDHLLGTDINGMDIWARVLASVRIDLGIAVLSVALAVLVGSTIGIVSGFVGRWVDDTVMRLIDILQAFPTFILALSVASMLGAGTANLIIVLAIVNAPAYARLVRAEVRTVRELPYIEAARLSGSSTAGIVWRHVVPNSLSPVRVIAPLNCGWTMLSLAGLSFVGLGVPIPQAEWGAMISLGSADIVGGRWWTSVPPGIALLICVLAFSMIGEGLQDRSTRRAA